MIFVLDSSNKERLQEAYNELAKLVQEKELKEASLLIFANKQVCYKWESSFGHQLYRVHNQKVFLFLNQNIRCGYSKQPPQ